MKYKKNGNRYSDDFRKIIVDLYPSGQKVKELRSECGVSDVKTYSWIKKLIRVDLDNGASITPDDYSKLQKQIQKQQEENKI